MGHQDGEKSDCMSHGLITLISDKTARPNHGGLVDGNKEMDGSVKNKQPPQGKQENYLG